MPIGTHLGPWLLGTNKTTTGSTAPLTRNTGAALVAQTSVVTTANDGVGNLLVATGIWLPAGARVVYSMIDLPSQFDYNACSGSGAIDIYLRTANPDSGAKNSTTAAGADISIGGYSISSTIPAYTRIVNYTEPVSGGSINLPNAINVSNNLNPPTDRQVWLLAYSTGTVPATLRVTVAYMVRNADGTYQPTSTTGP